MRVLHVLMPMGGLGSRFANAGYTEPKPLLSVDGMPMFLKAASSLDAIPCSKRYTFVLRRDQSASQRIEASVREHIPGAQLAFVDRLTRGAAETCLAAESLIDRDHGLVVLDCDLWFRSAAYHSLVEACLAGQTDDAGVLLCFQSDNPRYSYAEIAQGRVVRTAEKVVISNHALVGSYFFGRAHLFFGAARGLMARPIGSGMPEYYVSLLYNLLLSEGLEVSAAPVESYYSFGTPEELESYHVSRRTPPGHHSDNKPCDCDV